MKPSRTSPVAARNHRARGVAAARAAARALFPAVCSVLGACAPPAAGPPPDGLIRYVIVEAVRPEALARTGVGRRDPGAGQPGAWAIVPDLPRPERGLLRNRLTGAETTAALFAAPPGTPPDRIVVSASVAEALGIPPDGAAPLLVLALRREPRLVEPASGF